MFYLHYRKKILIFNKSFFSYINMISFKRFIFAFLRFSGIPLIFRELIQRNKITILLFHDLKEESAKKIFFYLKEHYSIISLKYYIFAYKNSIQLPRKSLIITFDDGHIGNFNLLHIVRKLKIPITIFVCSGIINTNRHFWFNYIQNKKNIRRLKKIPNYHRLRLLRKVGFEQNKEFPKPEALNKNQIKMMKNYFDFQSHTIFHPCLPNCTYKEVYDEIFTSKEILTKDFNLNIYSFSYPNGDYSKREIELVKNAGYKCAITVDYGFNDFKSDLFRLNRLSTNDSSDLNEIIVKASGLWGLIKKIIRKG